MQATTCCRCRWIWVDLPLIISTLFSRPSFSTSAKLTAFPVPNQQALIHYQSTLLCFQDQVCASIGFYSSPSPVTICCVLFALLSVNASCYVFLLQIVYRVLLQVRLTLVLMVSAASCSSGQSVQCSVLFSVCSPVLVVSQCSAASCYSGQCSVLLQVRLTLVLVVSAAH